MTYQAILFDMDGVVIDTHQTVTAFWERVAAKHGVQLTPADYRQHVYGCPPNHTLDRFFPALDPAQRQALYRTMNDYEANLTYPAVPGVLALLHALRQQRLPTALVTSGDRKKVDTVFRQLELHELFQTQVTVEEIKRGKPHPDSYRLAAQRLGLPPAHCLVFEDSLSGVQAAVAAGALCVGVQAAEGAAALRELGAAHVIPDFTATRLQVEAGGVTLLVDDDFQLAL